MTICVTGAAGFIGSHVADRLLADGHTVIGVDSFSNYYDTAFKEHNVAHNLDNPNYTLHRVNITDQAALAQIFADNTIDTVIHLAAQGGVRVSIEKPLVTEANNIAATYAVFEQAQKHGITSVIFASSSSVYGNREIGPFSETDNVDHPISPYAATKKACELIAYTYHHLYDMHMVGLRFFTVYGERGRPDMSPYIFAKAILDGTPLPKFGDGNSRRDYTYISDIVDGIVACLEKPLGYEIINLGNSHTISLNDYIATFEKVIGTEAVIDQQPPKPGDVKQTFANIEKAKQLLNWEPQVDLETGLTAFVKWFREHRV